MTESTAYNVIDLTGDLLNGDRITGPHRINCKFVIIRGPAEVLMVLGSLKEYPYHANLLDQFCRSRRLASNWVRRPDLVYLREPDYEILGGGYVEIQPRENVLRFSGASTAYGACPTHELKALVAQSQALAPYLSTLVT